MVLDTLDKLQQYAGLNPLFPEVLRFLAEHPLDTLAPGRHDILGDDLFVNIQDVSPRGRAEAKLESHQRMIDIQIPLSDSEEMGYSPLCDLSDAPYDAQKDISFYNEVPQTYLTVNPNQFVIFFPHDGHAPAISSKPFRKAIFKVKA